MHEVFAWFRGFCSLGVGAVSYIYGDLNGLLIALIIAICLDYITGLIKAGIKKMLSSEIGFKGILKKVLIMIIVGLAHVVDNCVGSGETWRNIAIVFYICNEGLSILENSIDCGLPVPDRLKNALLNMSESEVDDNGNNDNV